MVDALCCMAIMVLVCEETTCKLTLLHKLVKALDVAIMIMRTAVGGNGTKIKGI